MAAAEALLEPLIPHFLEGNTKIILPINSGAHFDETAAGLEGYARPLWVVAALLAARQNSEAQSSSSNSLLQFWIQGLQNGVDPTHKGYWGAIGDWDQRMVEAEILSFALLAAPDAFYAPLSNEAKGNLAQWLKGLNGKVMPENNWRFFRVMSNLALIKVCGEDRQVYWPLMEQDLQTLEAFYLTDGWSSDGVWRPFTVGYSSEGAGENAARGRHADYYSGSFAIQFSQLLYSKFASDLDPERCKSFTKRAKQFIQTFWSYFDTDGASNIPRELSMANQAYQGSAIPFGRSLCYRFAMGGFYAAFAYAGLCDDSDDFASNGAVKGMLLRHLRWWAMNSSSTFWPDGTLNIGYLYPNMYMSESYNSPQSPYWALKSLIVVALSSEDPFWKANELRHPLQSSLTSNNSVVTGIKEVKPARQIICNHKRGAHHFLLSSGQFCVWPMKATQAKYAKFAYSSAFGFSVPTGSLLAQTAPDSTLALSKDDEESWAVRWVSTGDTQFVPLVVVGLDYTVTALVNRWKPWSSANVGVDTTIIPPCDKWPDWHVRVHRIRRTDSNPVTCSSFVAVEGGFAIEGVRKSDRRFIPTKVSTKEVDRFDGDGDDAVEVAIEAAESALIMSSAGASGIADLSPRNPGLRSMAQVLKPDPNTNLMASRTLLPVIRHHSTQWPSDGIVLASAVFAISFKSGVLSGRDVNARWLRRPAITFDSAGNLSVE